jgi:phytoene dehydrogenase-like protein
MEKIIVAGAGLGGLIAAGLLAKRGYQVEVFERSSILGGRSHVLKKDGFTMSYGAHALIAPKAEPMKTIFRELGLKLNYNKPSITKFKLFSHGKVISNPLGTGAFTSPAIDGFMNRLIFFKRFFQMVKAKPEFDPGVSVKQWIDQNINNPSIARLITAFASLTVYDRALELYSMNRFVEHTNVEYEKNELLAYIGYDVLLDQLQKAIIENGGTIRFGHEVADLIVADGSVQGVVCNGQRLMANRVILGLPPEALKKIAAYEPLAKEINVYMNQSPLFAFVYDIQFSKRLRSDMTNLLDLDDGVYINDYSLNIPSSAPIGTQMLSCMRFLSSSEQQNDSHAERSQKSVEAIFDKVYPGWEKYVVGKRIIKRAIVNGIARRVGSRLLPLQSQSVNRLYFVGDSTTGRGALGIPCYDSALSVANMIAKKQ